MWWQRNFVSTENRKNYGSPFKLYKVFEASDLSKLLPVEWKIILIRIKYFGFHQVTFSLQIFIQDFIHNIHLIVYDPDLEMEDNMYCQTSNISRMLVGN